MKDALASLILFFFANFFTALKHDAIVSKKTI